MSTNPVRGPAGSPVTPRPTAPRPPVRGPAGSPTPPREPTRPPIRPGPRPAPIREPVRDTRTAPKASTRIDPRTSPDTTWSVGAWWRRSPLAIGLAAFFDSNAAPSQGLDVLSPAAINRLAAPDWPASAAEPLVKKGKLVGMVISPVDIPVIAPVPMPVWDAPPVIEPPPGRIMPSSPVPRPRPKQAPVEIPRPARTVDPRTGIRRAAPRRPKTQQEVTLVIERIGSGPRSRISVRAVQRFKYQVYANQRRNVDAKGVYLRLQRIITATFGTLTEVQDLVEAAAWNILDKNGVPAMLKARGAALDATEGMENATIRGVVVNFRQYHSVFNGLMDGEYQLDLGGFAFDYAMSQAADREIATKSKVMERMARSLGLDSVIGVQGMIGMGQRLHDQPRNEGMSYVREIQAEWEHQFKGRVFWSRQGLRYA